MGLSASLDDDKEDSLLPLIKFIAIGIAIGVLASIIVYILVRLCCNYDQKRSIEAANKNSESEQNDATAVNLSFRDQAGIVPL